MKQTQGLVDAVDELIQKRIIFALAAHEAEHHPPKPEQPTEPSNFQVGDIVVRVYDGYGSWSPERPNMKAGTFVKVVEAPFGGKMEIELRDGTQRSTFPARFRLVWREE